MGATFYTYFVDYLLSLSSPAFSSTTIKMKQMLLAALAVSALCVATAAPFRDAGIASIVLSDEEAKEAYGIMDLIPGVGELIEKLRPLIEEKIQILLDPNMDMNEKIHQSIEVCKQHAPEIVKIVGDFGLKVIIQTILPGIIASMGRLFQASISIVPPIHYNCSTNVVNH